MINVRHQGRSFHRIERKVFSQNRSYSTSAKGNKKVEKPYGIDTK